MINAVIYARFSSHNQSEQSIEGQLRYCKKYAEQCGYNIINTYIDRKMTGTNDNRPQFQQMITDSSKKQFQFVIVWKLDRFARNRYDSAIYKNKLKKNGVKVLSATEGVGEGDESIILEAVLEAMAETYSKQLSQNVERGLKESALKCQSTGGILPTGYKTINKKIVIDEEKADVVKYIFKQYANGVPKTKIIEHLNKKGHRTTKGTKFTIKSLGNMFTNRKYIGEYKYKDIIIPNGIPALIDVETFERCQKRAITNKRQAGHNKAKEEYLLTGKLFCGHCGATMYADSGTSKTKTVHHYYVCSAKKKKAKVCTKKREQKGFLEWYITEQTVNYILTPERIDIISQKVVDEYNKEFSKTGIQELKKELSRLNKEFEKLTAALINAKSKKMIDVINEEAEQIEHQITETEIQIAEKSVLAKAKIEVEEIKKWLQRFCKGDLQDIEFQKQIIDTLVNAVYLYDDKLIIYYNVKGGKQVSYIEMLEDYEKFKGSDIENTAPPKPYDDA